MIFIKTRKQENFAKKDRIKDLLKSRSLGEYDDDLSVRYPFFIDAGAIGAVPAITNKMISDSNLSKYDNSAQNDAMISHATKNSLIYGLGGALGGAALGALGGVALGAGVGNPLEGGVMGLNAGTVVGGIGGLIGGGLYGAFKGRDIARKRRENERKLIEKALSM